jgi:hypothetical protein
MTSARASRRMTNARATSNEQRAPEPAEARIEDETRGQDRGQDKRSRQEGKTREVTATVVLLG